MIAHPAVALSGGTRSLRHHLVTWLALLALLFHGALPLTYHLMQQRQAAAAGIETIVICTAFGMRTIQIGADGLPVANADGGDQDGAGQPDDQSGKGNATRYCPICLGAHQYYVLLPLTIMLAAPALLETLRYSIWSAAPPPEAARQTGQARAPPAPL